MREDEGVVFTSAAVARRDAGAEPIGVRQAFLEASASCAAERRQSVIGGWAGSRRAAEVNTTLSSSSEPLDP